MFGQELNAESYAICKADMLIKGQDVAQHRRSATRCPTTATPHRKFDYMLSNPPFGVEWKKVEKEVRKEHEQQGFNGRFGPGLPRVSDGSLLFLMHLLSKMRPATDGGSRFGIVLNGSPLFTGGAGSGESEIRRYVLENDLVEAIIGLPTDMFYNTGISTYVWIVSNRKPAARKGKVQLIDASSFWRKMRKSLGSKRKEMSEEQIADVTRLFGGFVEAQLATKFDAEGKEVGRAIVMAGQTPPHAPEGGKVKLAPLSRIFPNEAFGYRTITVERPLRDDKGKVVLGDQGQAEGQAAGRQRLARHRECAAGGGGRSLFQARGAAARARRLDRRGEDQGRLRNPVQPALLCVRAAAPARRDRRRSEAGDRPHQGDDRGARGMSGEVILYNTEDGRTQTRLEIVDGTVWFSQAEMADFFRPPSRTSASISATSWSRANSRRRQLSRNT